MIVLCTRIDAAQAAIEAAEENGEEPPTFTAQDFARKITVLDAVRFLNDGWEAVSQQTIQNCWAKVGWKVEEVQEGGGNEQAPQPRQPQVVVQVPEGGVVVEEDDAHWRVHVDDEELQDVL